MAMTDDEQEALEFELLEATQQHRDLVAATAEALAVRDRLVLRAIDVAELPQGTVAELAGVSRAQVHRIIATQASYADA